MSKMHPKKAKGRRNKVLSNTCLTSDWISREGKGKEHCLLTARMSSVCICLQPSFSEFVCSPIDSMAVSAIHFWDGKTERMEMKQKMEKAKNKKNMERKRRNSQRMIKEDSRWNCRREGRKKREDEETEIVERNRRRRVEETRGCVCLCVCCGGGGLFSQCGLETL